MPASCSASAAPPAGRDAEHGIALIFVLSILLLLSMLAASLLTVTRTEVQLAGTLREQAQAEALAEAGVSRAILGLLHPDPQAQWQPDGQAQAFAFADGEVRIAVTDEGGRINLNQASPDLLRGLFLSAGLAQSEAEGLADAVGDWVDPDDVRRVAGVEDADYAAAGLPYGAKDGPFETVEELQQVSGVTPGIFAAVAPALTVYTHQGGLDPMTAPREALLALPGVTAELADALIEARSDPTVDMAAIVAILPPGARAYSSRSPRNVVMVRAEAHGTGGAAFVREAIVRLTGRPGQPFQFHAWRQGELRAPAAEAPPAD